MPLIFGRESPKTARYKVVKNFFYLTKIGIVIFVLLSAIAGYLASLQPESGFHIQHFINLLVGTYFLSSGSLALNQVQEYKMDQKMNRTQNRPVAKGIIKPAAAGILAVAMIIVGSDFLYKASELSCALGWMTIILYNGFYTLWWKTRWVFAAVPGAIPGALPVTMGYAANTQEIFSPDSIFLFTILFLWQMPHFWALALKFKDDYQKAGVPTLPNAIGVQRTIYQMGLYTFSYCGVALMAPMFVTVRWFYLIAVFPVVVQIFIEFFRFLKSNGEKRWLAFFMWINVSVLVFLFIPAIDRWLFF